MNYITLKNTTWLTHTFAVIAITGAMGAYHPAAAAQEKVVVKFNEEVQAQASMGGPGAYWTAERLANAKPLDIQYDANAALAYAADVATVNGPPMSSPAGGPRVNLAPKQTNILYDPALSPQWYADAITPQDRGTSSCNYTSSRLIPVTADIQVPYRTIGKLFFTTPEGDAHCSASVIKNRIVVTAGHCVHSGNGQATGWYSNFLFVPAFRNGAAPYYSWTWRAAGTTPTWFSGGGVVPNAADYAMIEMNDNVINGVTRRIGDITGWLGWRTLSLSNNHAHILGYPANLDNGNMMHQVTAQSCKDGGNNTWMYGSDMSGGSSGGPIVQNFNMPAVGQTAGLNGGRLQLIGVVSYGYVSPDPKVQGFSIPDQRWVTLWNTACAWKTGNCN